MKGTVSVIVCDHAMLLRINGGMFHRLYDWCMVLDFIRDGDTVTIHNRTKPAHNAEEAA